ncbi:hypothetical protein BHE74_00006679 [Ensete ventricosum]|nr:hypothetical protein BHE74_00006679 [Ensete ventricosum]
MIGQSQVQASGRSEDNVVRNLLGVCRELTEGIGSLLRWRKGVYRKKTETHQKIVRDSRKAYREFGSGCTAIARVFGWLPAAEPPRPMTELPIPCFQGAFGGCTTGVDG